MATDLEFADYVCEQMRGQNQISHRKMFGEYTVYAGEKVVALVADNQVFVKPTDAGRALLGTPTMAPPYPGAKDFFLIDAQLDDRDFMATLIAATAHALPAPKPKLAKKKKAK